MPLTENTIFDRSGGPPGAMQPIFDFHTETDYEREVDDYRICFGSLSKHCDWGYWKENNNVIGGLTEAIIDYDVSQLWEDEFEYVYKVPECSYNVYETGEHGDCNFWKLNGDPVPRDADTGCPIDSNNDNKFCHFREDAIKWRSGRLNVIHQHDKYGGLETIWDDVVPGKDEFLSWNGDFAFSVVKWQLTKNEAKKLIEKLDGEPQIQQAVAEIKNIDHTPQTSNNEQGMLELDAHIEEGGLFLDSNVAPSDGATVTAREPDVLTPVDIDWDTVTDDVGGSNETQIAGFGGMTGIIAIAALAGAAYYMYSQSGEEQNLSGPSKPLTKLSGYRRKSKPVKKAKAAKTAQKKNKSKTVEPLSVKL